jgi:hypothetical protein
MKKILSTTLFIFIISFFVQAAPAQAVMRAVFPDGQSLQPTPQGSRPNISGNVNSTVTITPEIEHQADQAPLSPSEAPAPAQEKTSSFSIWWILYPLLAAGFILLYIKLKKRDTTVI